VSNLAYNVVLAASFISNDKQQTTQIQGNSHDSETILSQALNIREGATTIRVAPSNRMKR